MFPFTDRLSFDVLLLWDILCCKSCNKSGGFRLTERGKYRITQCLQDRGHMGNELHESAEEEDHQQTVVFLRMETSNRMRIEGILLAE